MRSIFQLAVATAALIGYGVAAPFQTVHPGGAKDIVIDKHDTVNGTYAANTTSATPFSDPVIKATRQLPLSFVNNHAGTINAYVTGLDPNNEVVMLKPDGSFYVATVSSSQKVPQPITANVAIPVSQGATVNIKIPDYISAARIWFAAGDLKFFVVADGNGRPALVEPSAANPSDPSANVDWGFVELTNNDSGIYANISYVDFVGLVLGMTLTASDGSTQKVPGLRAGAAASICNDLKARAASDGQPWDQLCMANSAGQPLRVMSPNIYASTHSSAFSNYYTNYINDVWSHYSSNTLTIDTQAAAGKVACRVSGSTLSCAGDNRGYSKPTIGDIWGCNSGPFAIQGSDNDVHRAVVPRLCAAFDRTTLLLSGGDVQPSLPPSTYYTANPTNWYSAIVHKYENNNIGYAFSYDDVGPSGQQPQDGLVSTPNPKLLTVFIGGTS